MSSETLDVGALYRAHRDDLFRYLSRLSGDPELAKDAVQETFVRAQSRPPRERAHVRAWLFRVATNVVRDRRKLEARRLRLLGGAAPEEVRPASAPDPHGALERAELRMRVRSALDALSEKERSALLLRAEGFAHREIAEALGTTTGSIGTLLARSLGKVHAILGLDREEITG